MADIKWIKLKVGMFNDDRIKVIQAMPEGDALIVIWIRMLILAGISNAEGYLMISENLPHTEDMLATIFNKPLSVVRLALKTFETFGMVEACNEGIFITDFAAEQGENMQDIREYNRIKKAESRERAKQKRLEMSLAGKIDSQLNVNDKSMTSQGNMSTCQDTDIEEDKDIIINNNIPQNPPDLGGKPERLDYEQIAALYNATCKDLPKVRGLSDERKRKIKTLLNALNKAKVLMELGAYERLEYIFRLADESDFLSGRSKANQWCGFDWLINAKNALKVIEGNYKNGGTMNYVGNTGGFQPGDAAHSCESENDALAAFRAGRGKDGGEDGNGV
jgi:predicted phage replisome organizer